MQSIIFLLFYPLVLTKSYLLVRQRQHLSWRYQLSNASNKRYFHQPKNLKLFSSEHELKKQMVLPAKKKLSSSDDDTPSSLSNKILYSVGSSTSLLVSLVFFVFLAVKRDALMVSFFLGAITNGIFSKVLKKILNQDRPPQQQQLSSNQPSKPNDKGMPSSHAMSLGFIGIFTALTLNSWIAGILILLYIITSLYYRIQTELHTIDQVAVGIVVGTTNGYLWRRYLVDGVTDFVGKYILNDDGILPIPFLIIPLLMGIIVVGSLERRISKFIDKKKD